jgi:hypothetical protein
MMRKHKKGQIVGIVSLTLLFSLLAFTFTIGRLGPVPTGLSPSPAATRPQLPDTATGRLTESISQTGAWRCGKNSSPLTHCTS